MTPLRRRYVLLGAFASALAPLAAFAAPPDVATVTAPVAALDAGLLKVMKAGKEPFPKRYALLEPVIRASFDLARIVEVAVGFSWGSIPESAQKSLLAVFSQYTIASYVANFNSYDGEQFRILPGLRGVGPLQVVDTEIVRRVKKPVKINYVMRHTTPGWRIVDVLLNGTISQVAVQRSDFSSTLVSGGASALIAALKKKVATLSAHTLS